MVSEELVKSLRCLKTGSQLTTADATLISALNAAIRNGYVYDMLGRAVSEETEIALVNDERSVLYPVVNGVLQMMADEAVNLESLEHVKNRE